MKNETILPVQGDTVFECPKCNQRMIAAAELAGSVVKCPSCSQQIIVPGNWIEFSSHTIQPTTTRVEIKKSQYTLRLENDIKILNEQLDRILSKLTSVTIHRDALLQKCNDYNYQLAREKEEADRAAQQKRIEEYNKREYQKDVIMGKIRNNARLLFPYNYDLQVFSINQEIEAYNRLYGYTFQTI